LKIHVGINGVKFLLMSAYGSKGREGTLPLKKGTRVEELMVIGRRERSDETLLGELLHGADTLWIKAEAYMYLG